MPKFAYNVVVIGEIIRGCMNKQAAVAAIRQKAAEVVAVSDQVKFIETIETNLMSLHKGNIARFRIKPSEYDEWMKTWR